MNLPWFRFYIEAIDDEKLRMLAFEDRWHYVAILCCKGQAIQDKEPDLKRLRRKMAIKLGLDAMTLDEVERRLVEQDLIEAETFQPIAWDKRQFRSDSSAERTRTWRDRLKAEGMGDVTSQRRHGDGQDTDTDTEEGAKAPSRGARGRAAGKHEYAEDFEQAWALYPTRPGANKLESFKAWKARLVDKCTADEMTQGVMRYAAYCRAMATEPRFVKQPATFFGPGLHFRSDWRVAVKAVGASAPRQQHRADWMSGRSSSEGGTHVDDDRTVEAG